MTIEGKMAYQPIGTGFWGIVGTKGEKWRPINLPENLKKEGLEVKLQAEKAKDQMSIFMWGEAVKILL